VAAAATGAVVVVVVITVVENGWHEEIRHPEGSRKQHDLF